MHPNGDSTLSDCEKRLDRLARRIPSLVHNREGDFLALGERMQDFIVRSNALADKAGGLAAMASGGAVVRAVRELSEDLERMSSAHGLTGGVESLAELDGILNVAGDLDAFVADFRRIVRTLQMLGVSTRIESARLGAAGQGFSTLADDVEGLAHKIVAHSVQVVDKSKRLKELVTEARTSAAGVIETRRGFSRDIFSSLQGNIDALAAFAASASDLSGSLAESARGIGRGVCSIVSSLQFHDIIRQQVEHVEHSLLDVLKMAEGDGELPEGNRRDLIGWIGDVCALQASQMANAKERFKAAVERVKSELVDVAGHVGRMGVEIESLLDGERRGESMLARVEQALGMVTGTIAEFSRQGQDIANVMNSVAETIVEMAAFVNDIEDVGAEIELIALNASVKAARTGEEGRALGVLASAIQRLSVEARGQTESVSATLREISRAADVLRQNAAGYLDAGRAADVSGRQRSLLTELRRADAELQASFEAIKAGGDDLAGDMRRTAEEIVFHRAAVEGMASAEEELREVSAWARNLVPQDEDEGRPARLKEMLGRYTMEVERLLHQELFTDGSPAAGTDSPGSGAELFGEVELFGDEAGESSEFGDNVELF